MAKWKGVNTIFGFSKSTDWGTPVAVGADEKVLILSESLTPDAQFIPSLSLSGSAFQGPGDKGNEFHSGDVPYEVDFDTVHRMLAFAMGTAGSPTDLGDCYRHTLRFTDDMEGTHATLVVGHLGMFVREYTTVKFGNFSFEVTNGNRMQGTMSMIPHGLNTNTTTGTNELTGLADIALPTDAGLSFANFNQLEVLENDADGATLTPTTDDLYPSAVSLNVNQNFPTDDVTTQYAPYIDEPIRDGFAEITGTLTFSKLTSETQIALMLSKARRKMKWTFTGPIAHSTQMYEMVLRFSNVQYESGGFNAAGPGRVPQTLNFRAHVVPSGTPHTGFTYADALYAEVVNRQSADPLA